MKNVNKKMVIITSIIIVLVLALAGIFFLRANVVNHDNDIVYTFSKSSIESKHTLDIEYSNETINPLDYVEMVYGTAVSNPELVNTNALGETDVIYTFFSENKETTKTVSCKFIVKDTKAPVITLVSDTVETATMDGYDPNSNITSIEDPVDGSLPKVDEEPTKLEDSTDGKIYDTGWYTVTVNDKTVTIKASDKFGNVTEKTFTITTTEPEPTPTVAAHPTELYYYPSVDLNDGSNWVQMGSYSDMYYSACTYMSGQYSTIDEAVADVVAHEAAKGRTIDANRDVRKFMEKDASGSVVYYQAGYEED